MDIDVEALVGSDDLADRGVDLIDTFFGSVLLRRGVDGKLFGAGCDCRFLIAGSVQLAYSYADSAAVYIDLDIVGRSVDLDVRNGGVVIILFQVVTDLVVLFQIFTKILFVSEPSAAPGSVDPNS